MEYDVVFESERIQYIKVTDKLVQEYVDMVNDENVQKYITHNKYNVTIENELEWIKKKINNNELIFSMIDKETKQFIGNIEITILDNNVGDLGISIKSSMQDKQYGSEAIKRAIEYAFNELNLNEIELDVYADNTRAIHVYKKLGFTENGPGKDEGDIHMSIRR